MSKSTKARPPLLSNETAEFLNGLDILDPKFKRVPEVGGSIKALRVTEDDKVY